MKKYICVLVAIVSLTACTTTPSDADPLAYKKSLEQAKTILKTNKSVKKYEKYYNLPNSKAFAQSKVNSAAAYATNKTSVKFAMDIALEICHQRLLKKYDAITDRVSCEIVNVDNEWVSK